MPIKFKQIEERVLNIQKREVWAEEFHKPGREVYAVVSIANYGKGPTTKVIAVLLDAKSATEYADRLIAEQKAPGHYLSDRVAVHSFALNRLHAYGIDNHRDETPNVKQIFNKKVP